MSSDYQEDIPNDGSPYIDPTHFLQPEMLDPRCDPQGKTNDAAYWEGYGRFREGVWYTQLLGKANSDHLLAGWFFGFTEGKRKKKWWQSKFLWLAVGVGVATMLAWFNPSAITENPDTVVVLSGATAVAIAVLRFVTNTAVVK
jgi:hypothetical protein